MTFNEVCDAVESGRSVWVPSEFVDAVRLAASRARATREIGLIQFWRINAALRNSRQLAKIYAGVVDEAASCRPMQTSTSSTGSRFWIFWSGFCR